MKNEKTIGFCENEMYDERMFDDNYTGQTVCAQCGYRFTRFDDIIRINSTGDVIHKDCWIEYSDENVDSLSTAINL